MVTLAATCVALGVARVDAAAIIYPAGGGTVGGTLVDGGLYGVFDGVPDAWDWTFNGVGGYEGVLTLARGAVSRPVEQRVVWEYDVSSLPDSGPFTAYLVFQVRGAPIFPFPDVTVHVYSYPADLAEQTSDYMAEPIELAASVVVTPFIPQNYQVNITPAVVHALRSGGGKLGLRFQIDPDTVLDSNQAFMDIIDTDDNSKPTVYSPSTVLGDGNRDGVIAVDDLPSLTACLGGPGDTVSTSCLVFDFDADFDVDAADVAWFARVHTLFAGE